MGRFDVRNEKKTPSDTNKIGKGFGSTGSGHGGSNTFLFQINVLTSLPPLSFVLRYAIVSLTHSDNRPPSLHYPQSNLTCSAFSALLVPEKASLRKLFPPPNPFPILFVSDGVFFSFLTSNLPIFPGF